MGDYIPQAIEDLYEVHNFRHAAEVLATGCSAEFEELMEALAGFRLTTADILAPGGNESQIPKRVAALLFGRRAGSRRASTAT
ncbi:Restriction endonuclease, type II, BglII [mine drainage metagenome]|uniref:Restriction endonuclease BglII n=1 Tax=mine drainage metagenome TaxID=410659 RepID=T1CDR4_9ZZZZ